MSGVGEGQVRVMASASVRGAVVRPLACRAKVPGFKSRQNLSGQPVSL